jgi:hypothetical protein
MSKMMDVQRKSGRCLSWSAWCAAVVLAMFVSLAPSRAHAIYMTLNSSKTPEGTVKLCVGVESGGQKVAGTQNDLIWDGSCANLKASTCAAVPEAKKPLHGNIPANTTSTYRALVFALDNVDPMHDGPLYCCEFEMTGPGDGCCAVRFDRLGASDPVGTSLPTTGNPERLCLATGAAPAGAAPPSVATAPGPPPSAGGGPWPWLILVVVGAVLVAILVVRGRSS